MRNIQATALRKDLFGELRRLVRGKEPVEILRLGKVAAFLVPPPAGSRKKPPIDLDRVSAFCKTYKVDGFYLFGSILRDDFNERSDVDVVLDTGGRRSTFPRKCAMLDDLELMFGRKVDVLMKHTLDSPDLMNRYRKESILSSMRLIHRSAESAS